MKAKTVSLIVKIVAEGMLVATWVKVVFFTPAPVNIWAVIVLTAGVLAVFGDVSLNIFMDKLAAMKGKES